MRAQVVAMSGLIFVRARLQFTLRHEGPCRKWMRFKPVEPLRPHSSRGINFRSRGGKKGRSFSSNLEI
jgi:hypothetical protein